MYADTCLFTAPPGSFALISVITSGFVIFIIYYFQEKIKLQKGTALTGICYSGEMYTKKIPVHRKDLLGTHKAHPEAFGTGTFFSGLT